MMTRTAGLGVPCAKCGETVFVYQEETPPTREGIDFGRFVYATNERKGKPVKDVLDNDALCPNGCKWTLFDRLATFDPRNWNEIRIDG